MIAFVFKPRRRVCGKLRKARTFSGRYRLSGDLKLITVPLGVRDKEVAKEKLRRIVREEEHEREGLIGPKAEREAAKRPLEVYVEEYADSRRALGRDEKYVGELRRKLLRLLGECG